jgi:hypothetical protein
MQLQWSAHATAVVSACNCSGQRMQLQALRGSYWADSHAVEAQSSESSYLSLSSKESASQHNAATSAEDVVNLREE